MSEVESRRRTKRQWPQRRMTLIEGWDVSLSLHSARTSWYLAQMYALSQQYPIVWRDWSRPDQPFFVSIGPFLLPKRWRHEQNRFRRFPAIGVSAQTISLAIERLCLELSQRLEPLLARQRLDDLWDASPTRTNECGRS